MASSSNDTPATSSSEALRLSSAALQLVNDVMLPAPVLVDAMIPPVAQGALEGGVGSMVLALKPQGKVMVARRKLTTVTVTTEADLVANLLNDTTIELGADILLTLALIIQSDHTGLVIDGMGLYKVDGQGSVRCFYVAGAAVDVVLQNLTITNGYAVGTLNGHMLWQKSYVPHTSHTNSLLLVTFTLLFR